MECLLLKQNKKGLIKFQSYIGYNYHLVALTLQSSP